MHPQPNLRISYDTLTLIIDKLWSEDLYFELKACSQTCRMLLHPCRFHIFSAIDICNLATVRKFANLLQENSTIEKYIRKLTLRVDIMNEDFANALLLLNIRRLYVRGPSTERCWGSLSPHMQHAFAHVLNSHAVAIYQYDIPASLLSGCPAIKHLTLDQCQLFSEACESINILTAPPRLLSLNLLNSSLSPEPSLKKLPDLQMRRANGTPIVNLSDLRYLTVHVCNNRQEIYFDQILRSTPQLEGLKILVYHGITPDNWVRKLTIIFPTLRSLTLRWVAHKTPTNLALPGLIKTLETMTHGRNFIDELSIMVFTDRSCSRSLPQDWERLDQILSDRSSFPQLRNLTIRLHSGYIDNSMKRELEAGFNETKNTTFPKLTNNDSLKFKLEGF